MARLMAKNYVDQLVQYDEKEFFLGATFMDVGFRQESVFVTKKDKGSSVYNLSRKIALMVNAIVSTSNKPLIYVFYFGALISFISFAFIIGLLIPAFFLRKAHDRLAVAHRFSLVPWRADHSVHRSARYLSFENLYGNETPPYSDR